MKNRNLRLERLERQAEKRPTALERAELPRVWRLAHWRVRVLAGDPVPCELDPPATADELASAEEYVEAVREAAAFSLAEREGTMEDIPNET
jgi:hypothetical protein